MSESTATLQAILDRVVQMQAQMGQVQVQVGQVQAEHGESREAVLGRIGQVQTELSQVHTEQNQLRHELAQLDARVTQNHTDVMARLDKMQSELTLHVESRVVDFSTGERAEKIAKDTQAHLTALVSSISDQVNGMWRVIHHLQTEVRELRRGAS